MVHTPEQQSLALKQMSLSGWQPVAVVMHVPPLQFCVQQSLLPVQALLSVTQVLLGLAIAAHLPPVQLALQQSLLPVQALPFCVHSAPHMPLVQMRPQHCTPEVHALPCARQPMTLPPPGAPPSGMPPGPMLPTTQVLEVVSHVPTQHIASVVQAPAGGTQDIPPCDMSLPPPVVALW
jgi:hypothetical protein